MTEVITPQSSENSPEKQETRSWEKLFMAILDISTRTGIPVLELGLTKVKEGKIIRPRGHWIDQNLNPRLVVIDVYQEAEPIQRAIAIARWEKGKPTVMFRENTSGACPAKYFQRLRYG